MSTEQTRCACSAGDAVPAGSILLFDGVTNPDRVIAVDPSTGLILSTLILTKNYDMTGGLYDPFSGRLYIIDRTINPSQVVAIDPATGAEIAGSRFNLPVNAGEAGLALDPSGDGTFWYGSPACAVPFCRSSQVAANGSRS